MSVNEGITYLPRAYNETMSWYNYNIKVDVFEINEGTRMTITDYVVP